MSQIVGVPNNSYKPITNTREFAPGFVNYKKGAFDSQPQVIKFTSFLPMVGGSLRVHRLLPPLKLVAMTAESGNKHQQINQIQSSNDKQFNYTLSKHFTPLNPVIVINNVILMLHARPQYILHYTCYSEKQSNYTSYVNNMYKYIQDRIPVCLESGRLWIRASVRSNQRLKLEDSQLKTIIKK